MIKHLLDLSVDSDEKRRAEKNALRQKYNEYVRQASIENRFDGHANAGTSRYFFDPAETSYMSCPHFKRSLPDFKELNGKDVYVARRLIWGSWARYRPKRQEWNAEEEKRESERPPCDCFVSAGEESEFDGDEAAESDKGEEESQSGSGEEESESGSDND